MKCYLYRNEIDAMDGHKKGSNADGDINVGSVSDVPFLNKTLSHADLKTSQSKNLLSESDLSVGHETVHNQKEDAFVKERSTLLHATCDQKENETPSYIETNTKSKPELSSLNKRKSFSNGSTPSTSLFSGFSTWKSSAGYVLESIREKLSYFKRGKSMDASVSLDITSRNQQPNHFVPPKIENDSSSTTNSSDASQCTMKSIQALKLHYRSSSSGDTSTEKTLTDKEDLCSLYDNDDHAKPIENSSNEKVLDDTNPISLNQAKPLKLEEIDNLSIEPIAKAGCSNSSLCSPCIGSKLNAELFVSPIDKESQNNCLLQENPLMQIYPKIIYDQPGNSQSKDSTDRKFLSDNDNFSTIDENSESFRPQLISIPDVKLQSATPSCSVNQELYLHCSFTDEGDVSKESSEGNLDLDPHSDTSDYASIRDKRGSIPGEKDDRRINDDASDAQYGINMWQLRNSLEQNTIEIHCPITAFNDFEEKNEERRFSITTDGMTEASPLSTPSSEFNNFHGKSISDSEEDVRAYFVTPSGRISPRQPHFHQRNTSSGFDSSLDRVSNEHIPKNNWIFTSVSEPLTAPVYSESRDPTATATPKNILVTQATIETPKQTDHRKESMRLSKIVSEDSSTNVSLSSTCEEKRSKFFGSPKWSTVSDGDEILSDTTEIKRRQAASKSRKAILHQLPRQTSLPLPTEHSIMHLPDCIEEQPTDYHSNLKHDSYNTMKGSTYHTMNHQPLKRKTVGQRGRLLYSSNSISSDEVFLSDSQSSMTQSNANYWSSNNYRTTRCDPKQISSYKTHHNAARRTSYNSTGHSLTNSDSMLAPPAPKLNQKQKFHNKLGSATSSGTSSPTSPSSSASEKPTLKSAKSVDMESDDSISSRTSSSRSSSSIRSLTKIFRRPNRNRQRRDSVPLFCGYSMERDYCVDSETDRIFKTFLSGNDSSSAVPVGEPLPPPSHMLPPPPLKNTSSTQLRRQVMRKQYSDTIAMYYGQRQRRWRFITKQKSDSVNCPIDRGIFRRQDRIDEEFDPEEINERLSSTSSHRESERQSDFVPPTVHELKQWRRSSEDRKLCHTSSLPICRGPEEPSTSRTNRRVTFEPIQIDLRSRSYDHAQT